MVAFCMGRRVLTVEWLVSLGLAGVEKTLTANCAPGDVGAFKQS